MLNRRMLWVLCLAAVVSVCAAFVADPFPVEAQTAAPNASSQLATLDFTVSDAATGYALRTARIRWGLLVYPIPDPLPESSPVEAFGKLRLSLNPGQYVFEIEAPGYKRTRTHFGPSGRDHLPINVPMTRITPPQELQQDVLDSKTRAGVNLVVGYIVDAASLEPVSGVQVRIANSRGVSNSQGYYEVYAEVPNPPKDPDNLTLETLVATAKGYKKYTLSDVSLASESYSLINIQLARGVGETSEKTGVATLPKGTPATPPEPGPAIDDRLLQWLSVPAKLSKNAAPMESEPINGENQTKESAVGVYRQSGNNAIQWLGVCWHGAKLPDSRLHAQNNGFAIDSEIEDCSPSC